VLSRAFAGNQLVTWTKRPGDALALFDGGMHFDLILCDLDAPDLSGVAFYRELERSRPEQAGRVIFLAGASGAPETTALLGSAANWRVDKPLEPEPVRDVIRAALAGLGRCATRNRHEMAVDGE
jgi:DNA-binding response OmpR family regulator